MDEFVFEWCRGDSEITATVPSSTNVKSKIKKLAEQYPDEVKIVHENSDGSIVAHLPVRYLSVRHPKQLSEESKRAMAERLQALRVETEVEDDE